MTTLMAIGIALVASTADASSTKPSTTPTSVPEDAAPSAPAQLQKWTLIDGSTVVGREVSTTQTMVKIRLVDGTERELYRTDIASQIRQKPVTVIDGRVWFDNPNRTRHLWAPSAIPLRKGESYFSAKMGAFVSAVVGVTENVALLGGTFWPGLLVGGDGINAIGAIKYGDQLSDNVYWALGTEVIFFPSVVSIATPFLGVTFGKPDRQITVNLGYLGILDSDGSREIGEMMISIAGQLRFLPEHALVVENLLFPGTRVDGSNASSTGWGMFSLHTLCYRRMDESSAWDYGVILVSDNGNTFPLPWVDYTWYFGEKPETTL